MFTLKRNFSGKFEDKKVLTNKHGYRDEEFSYQKPEGQIRILALGDSVTFGDGVGASDTFPEQLEDLLVEKCHSKSFQVVNAGTPGNGPMQEYYDLKEGLKLDPDAIILQFTLNDVTEPFTFLKRLGGSGWSYHGIRDIPALDYYLGQRSALYSLAKNWYAKTTYQGDASDTLKERGKKQEIYQKEKLITQHDHKNIQTAWKEYFDWLIKITDTCRSEPLPLVILICPFEFQLALSPEKDYPQRKLIDFCKTREIPHVNLIDVLRTEFEAQGLSYSNDSEIDAFWDRFFHDHDHFSEFGHKYVANLLFSHVGRELNLNVE